MSSFVRKRHQELLKGRVMWVSGRESGRRISHSSSCSSYIGWSRASSSTTSLPCTDSPMRPCEENALIKERGYCFFGRYILSARSLSELSGGNCAQSRPRLYSSRAQPHSVFFQDQVPPLAPPPAPAGRWADDPEMAEESAWILFPVSFSLLAQDPWAAPRAHTVSCPAMTGHTNIYTSERG